MSLKVTPDIIEYASVSRRNRVVEVKRGFLVEGLSGTSPVTLQTTALNANDGANHVPVWGEAHPGNPVDGMSIYARDKDVIKMDDDDAVIVVVTYGPPTVTFAPALTTEVIETGASLKQTQTSYDASGARINLHYSKAPADETAVVPKFIPMSQYIVNRTETTDPTAKAQRFVGKLNNATWKGAVTKSMMCMEIKGVSQDGGVTFKTRYVFEYDPATPDGGGLHKQRQIFHRLDGSVPDDITEGDGQVTADVQYTDNFNDLGL